jgi:hypothetical protein
MEYGKVKFEDFERVPEHVNDGGPIQRIIADAVKKVVDSTPHRVTYDVTENEVVERKWMKEKTSYRYIELKLTVKIPVQVSRKDAKNAKK